MRSVLVVGGSLAGLRSVQALREHGFDGAVTVVSEEHAPPYDRPPLTKELLRGELEPHDIALAAPTDLAALDVEWLSGRRAAALDAARRTVTLADGEPLTADAIVIATGARARRLPFPPMAGVFTIRTLEHALALRAALRAGSPRVTVVGAGFLGAEVAASARSLGLDTLVLEAAPTPLERAFGSGLGAVWTRLHADHGTRLRCGVQVTSVLGSDRVEAVTLASGETIPTDVLVMAVGSTPNTEWLQGSGLYLADGVTVAANGTTACPGVSATGDVASTFCAQRGRHVRNEHWTFARDHSARTAAALLGEPVDPATLAPYLWSDQYGSRIQFAGARLNGDTFTLVDGTLHEARFVGEYSRDGHVNALVAVDSPRAFGQRRRELNRNWSVARPAGAPA